jgi:hypothetical protein
MREKIASERLKAQRFGQAIQAAENAQRDREAASANQA